MPKAVVLPSTWTAAARRAMAAAQPFVQDRRGAGAVEFSIVAMPFILLLLGLPQMGVYYATQSSLDAGVIQAADSLTNSYYGTTAPTAMTAAGLKTLIVSKSGGMVRNDTTLAVDLRKLSSLGSTVSPIAGTMDTISPKDVVVVRAQASVTSVVPFMGTMVVRSAVIVRRQAL